MHICQRSSVAIGRSVVYYVWAAHIFSAQIKCWHCKHLEKRIKTGKESYAPVSVLRSRGQIIFT